MNESELKKLASLRGREYWRSLDQLAETEEFKDFLQREFPEGASEMANPITRRRFLTFMGASLGMAGLAGCRRPVEKIIPYVTAPEEVIPGIPQHYATTMPFGNAAFGVVVESHEGRPTKIEGNKQHPASLGGSNLFMQSSILNLYDPDRSKRVLHDGAEVGWNDFVAFWRARAEYFAQNSGAGLAILCEPFSSPTLFRLREQFLKRFPAAQWVTYEPVSDENILRGIKLASGSDLRPRYDFSEADVILSLDSDFLQTESENVTNAAGFAAGRRMDSEKDSLNRLYIVESAFSLTGTMADHRLRLQSRRVGAFTAALALELDNQGLKIAGSDSLPRGGGDKFDQKWLRVVAGDLISARGKSLVVAGRRQPAEVHALVYAINRALGNIGVSVEYFPMQDATASDRSQLRDLVAGMKQGAIDTLIVAGGNPLYDAPIDLEFKEALAKVAHSVHLSLCSAETSQVCSWHLPQTHYLESWGDARSIAGTLSVIQPLIEPLFGGKSMVELFGLLASGDDQRGYEIVRDTWRSHLPEHDYEKSWRRVLHDGLLADSGLEPVAAKANDGQLVTALKSEALSAPRAEDLEIVFCSSPRMYDGRFANNGWLQEIPDPVSKITWDNAALISPATARELGIKSKEMVRLSYRDRTIELPVWVLPGQADRSITVELGYGREQVGRVGNGVGANLYRLRTSDHPDFGTGATIVKTGALYEISNTQDHSSMEGRPLVREATLAEYREDPNFAPEMVEHPPLASLWTEHTYEEGYQWGMTIDLNLCTGCNACVAACQSENNIPVVGKEQVGKGREMQWIRTDRYFTGPPDDPQIVHQPVACVHCENAPCEQVCPVAATVHDDEGLNVMVYNRCIGTRYCSNNCPYKVRRFNFFNYTGKTPETLKMANNPDVTVRSRGVMEKCTYCVQRISRAKVTAKEEGRLVRDGEIVTACQQACPVGAITFGNVNDPDSKVSIVKRQNRNYGLLEEINTRPRTTYLARIRNPHPELVDEEKKS